MENQNKIKHKGNNKKNRSDAQNEKKPFNKKKYREKKYSNKFKVKQWEEQRRKKVIRGFLKELKHDEKVAKFSQNKVFNNQSEDNNIQSKKARLSLLSIKQDLIRKKQEKKEQILKTKQEREEALRIYREKKKQAYKELSKKTKKGQPVMKGRIELLLEKIRNST